MAFQGIFRKHETYVVVKTIILSSKSRLEIGTVIDPKKHHVRPFQMRILFRKRRLGIEGSDWANEMLKLHGKGHTRPETAQIQEAKAKVSKAEAAKAKKAEAKAKKPKKASPKKKAADKPKWSNS